MAPIGGVLVDTLGRCSTASVTLRTTSAVVNGVVFFVVRTTRDYVFLEPDDAMQKGTPLQVFLPLAITKHLPFAPTLVLRTPPPGIAPKKRRTLEVASLHVAHWVAAVEAAHHAQPRCTMTTRAVQSVNPPPAVKPRRVVVDLSVQSKPTRAKHATLEDDEDDMDDVAEAEVDMDEDEDETIENNDDVIEHDDIDDAEDEEEESESEDNEEEDEFEAVTDDDEGEPVNKRFRPDATSGHV